MGVFDFTYKFNSSGSPEMDEIFRQQLENQRAYDESSKDRKPGKKPTAGGFATNNTSPRVLGMNDHGLAMSRDAFASAMGAAGQQSNTLQSMIDQTTAAWQKEHDSRVAQERERRRMEHEKEMMRMQAVAQRQPMVDEGAIIRSLLMG